MTIVSTLLGPNDLLGELSTAHHEIRGLLDRLDLEPSDRMDVAEELCLAMAKHRASCTESVLRGSGVQTPDHEQQARLLRVALHGIEQLVDRLRLPASEPRMIDNLVQALRMLVLEHERLEIELALAGAHPGPELRSDAARN